MAKTKKTRSVIQAAFAAAPDVGRSNGDGKAGARGIQRPSRQELMSIVCKYHCRGYTATEICKLARKEYGVRLTREQPFQYIRFAASKSHLRYIPPLETSSQFLIQERYGWLQDLNVVHTATVDDVAYQGAVMLLGLVRRHYGRDRSREVIRIGLAGGHMMRKTCRFFSQLLAEAKPTDLPRRIVLHSMVAGFDINDPTTDPNAFFTYFVSEPALHDRVSFVGLHAPAMVTTQQYNDFKTMDDFGIKECFVQAKDLDILVTSAAARGDKHSLFEKYMQRRPTAYEKLCDPKHRYRGDMLWRPLGDGGPIEDDLEIRAMTLVELSELPGLIAQGKSVLLVLGPCGVCHEPKTPLFQTILDQPVHLVSHAVVASRTASGLKLSHSD